MYICWSGIIILPNSEYPWIYKDKITGNFHWVPIYMFNPWCQIWSIIWIELHPIILRNVTCHCFFWFQYFTTKNTEVHLFKNTDWKRYQIWVTPRSLYRDMNTCKKVPSLLWRHNERDCISNHQPRDCLLNRLFRSRSKKTSNLRVSGFCAGNSRVVGE